MKYIYIDDYKNEISKGKAKGLENSNKGLEILVKLPEESLEKQIQVINSLEFDGLILDLKLGETPIAPGKRAPFNGTTLAQEIRNRQTLQEKNKQMKVFPIVLFSANDSLLEKTNNLFDLRIDKDKSEEIGYLTSFQDKLLGIVDLYKQIEEKKKLKDLLALNGVSFKNNASFKDNSKFMSDLNTIMKTEPIYVFSQFLISQVLGKSGILIDENILAARLGIDKTSESWSDVKSSLKEAQYTGVLCKGWPRWWMPIVTFWWEKVIKCPRHLQGMPADIRIKIISEALGIKKGLRAPDKHSLDKSTEYWTVCTHNLRPIDPIDGLVLAGQDNKYQWQDKEYVSIEVAINSVGTWKKKIDIDEVEHLKELWNLFKKQ